MNEDIKDCGSCLILQEFANGLRTVDAAVFDTLANDVFIVLGSLVTLVLIFRVQFHHYLRSFSKQFADADVFADLLAYGGRLAFCSILLLTSNYWREMIIDNINGSIGGVAVALLSVVNSNFSQDISLDGTAYYMSLSHAIWQGVYAPSDLMWQAINSTSFGVRIDKLVAVALIATGLSLGATLCTALMMLFLFGQMIMTMFVAGLGPILIGLWIFPSMRHYAYGPIKMLIASGITVVTGAFLTSIMTAAITQAFLADETVVITDSGAQFNLEQLWDWVFSWSIFTVGLSYAVLFFLLLLVMFFVLYGVLTSGPQTIKVE